MPLHHATAERVAYLARYLRSQRRAHLARHLERLASTRVLTASDGAVFEAVSAFLRARLRTYEPEPERAKGLRSWLGLLRTLGLSVPGGAASEARRSHGKAPPAARNPTGGPKTPAGPTDASTGPLGAFPGPQGTAPEPTEPFDGSEEDV